MHKRAGICIAAIAIIALGLAPSPAFPQNNIIAHERDSIINRIKAAKEDTAKVTQLDALSRVYSRGGKMQDAMETGKEAIETANRSHNNIYISKAYGNLAAVYYDQGNYPAALDYYLQVLSISRQENYSKGMSSAYVGAGNVYKAQGDNAKALDYYLKALDLDTQAKRRKGMADCYNNIGNAYWNIKDYNNALNFYLKSLDIDEELKDNEGIAADLTNMGNVYSQLGDTAKALDNYNKALGIYTHTDNRSGIAILTGNIGGIFYKQKKLDEAEKYLTASVKVAVNAGNLVEARYDYFVLSSLYASMGKWQDAYMAHSQYSQINDSLYNKDRVDQMGRLEAKFEYDKQLAAQQAANEKAAALSEAASKRQMIVTLLIGAIALMAIIILLFIFRLLKAARREKLIAEQQKSLMELKALRAQMNPHFIFNAINSIQHFILKNDPDAAQKHLNKFSKLIRKVLENSKLEGIPLSEEIQMLQLYTELESVRFSSKFQYNFVVSPELNIDTIMVPPLLIQPFVENAIWHGLMHLSERQGALTVAFEKQDSMLKCIVDDNGIGRERSQGLREEARHQPMGLSITHERVNILNEVYHSHISVNVTDKKQPDGSPAGTRVELLIPLTLNKTSYA